MELSTSYTRRTGAAKALAKEIGISPILCRLLLQRGITSAGEAKRFFRPQLNELHDPFLMKDMSLAVERLNKAMGRKERIMVYGDYDVDGTTAVALVYKFLQQFYSNIDYYIPDRYNEGYGVSKKGVDYAYENRRKADYCVGLWHQSGRGNRLCQGKRYRFYHLRPSCTRRYIAGRGCHLEPETVDSTYPTITCRVVEWASSLCKPLH